VEKDLDILGGFISLAVGLGLVKGQAKRELQAVGTLISIGSGIYVVARLLNR
jgi:hypothetical protein